ncbi:MAG TPA: hypothetical protein VFI34_12155 [Candidatus Limnocylindrales bacterium]|nr:hypothetical protein [Candidatus Limnocylindrales bacterium]
MQVPSRRVDPPFPSLRVDRRRRSRRRTFLVALFAAVLAAGALGSAAIATDTLGAGHLWERLVAKVDRFLSGPPPDRPTLATVEVSDDPGDDGEEPAASPSPAASVAPVPSGQPTPAPTPTPPPRVAVDVDILQNHTSVFAHEIRDDWCSPAGVTTVLAILGLGAPTDAREKEIASRVGEWESYQDSHNGEWGPAAMALALDAYGAKGYEIRAYTSRRSALRGAAAAISKTSSPAILLAWRGAHTWVMSGYRADADPVLFKDAKVSGAYILDPWYPWNSSIWGQSDPPGTFQDAAEMERNFLPWKRPEGSYPDRDGKFIVVIPTIPRG